MRKLNLASSEQKGISVSHGITMTQPRSALDFLSHLRGLDIQLTLQDERLACSAPKGALDPELIAELKAKKSEIVELLRASTYTSVSDTPIVASHRTSRIPPSFAQERSWRSDQEGSSDNVCFGLRLRGAMDLPALTSSFQEILRRHQVLRTTLIGVGAKPMGFLQTAEGWKMDCRSFLEMPAAQQEEEWKRAAAEEVRHRFDVASDVLIHVCLLVLTPEDHVLIVSIHPVAADRRSLGILTAELSQLYNRLHKGQPSELPEPPIQYADYADWKRHRVENGAFHAQSLYWSEQLRTPVSVAEIPVDRPRPAKRISRDAEDTQVLHGDVYNKVQSFASTRKATPFVVLVAAFNILLFRFTSQTDVTVGSTTEGRRRKELETLVGPFTHTLVFRTDLSGDPTGEDVLSRVSTSVLNAFAHQDLALEELLDASKPDHHRNRTPLFQAMFMLDPSPKSAPEMTGLSVESLELHAETSGADLAVEIFDDERLTFQLAWTYSTELFDLASIRRLQESYGLILEQLIEQPVLPISKLRIITPLEQARLLAPGERLAYPDLCIHEWFAQQATTTPHAIAATCGSEQVTYRELLERTNRLANRLRAMCVGPGVLAGVCLQRSIDMLVSVLAILTAGGAYLPLDPEYPSERLNFMLADSGAAVLVTEDRVLHQLAPLNLRSLCLDREHASLLAESSVAPVTGGAPHDLAYVIYTSGSTGKPKGVKVTHRSVVNLLASVARQIPVGLQDRFLAVTTLSFDIAGLELYLPLVCGAQVILVSREASWSGTALGQLLSQSGATMMQATPVTWRLLLDAGWTGLHGFKILCGGEALPQDLAHRLLATGGELWNLYGPTETTIWSTMHRVDRRAVSIPIGRPIANTEAYVLDANRELMPVGVPGELFLGGDGLAEGYLNRPELNAEKFVAHPFRPGERLFRTGDLVRWAQDGNLEYLGRLDHQIKLRGYRIELGEIEAVLQDQPAIRQAAVVVQTDAQGEKQLTAFLTAQEPIRIDVGALREALARKLSSYMVPSAFVQLDELPLTPNKKVDRKALAALSSDVPASSTYVPPGNATEQAIAGIWQALLRRERIGIADNFFDSGGYSLLVVQLQSRLRRHFHKEISLVELFQHPTVASQARLLTRPEPIAPSSPQVRAAPGAAL